MNSFVLLVPSVKSNDLDFFFGGMGAKIALELHLHFPIWAKFQKKSPPPPNEKQSIIILRNFSTKGIPLKEELGQNFSN